MAQRLQDRPTARRSKDAKRNTESFKGLLMLLLGLRSFKAGLEQLLFGRSSLGTLIPFLLGLALFIVGIRILAGKDWKKGQSKGLGRKTREETFTPSRPTERPSFSFRENDHQHIVATGLSVQRQLEQLETLRGAGLYTKEEYLEKKREILRQR